jgi:crotonobetainyl-CoA:carnitine CoA-transferase CaiB-like acyl-CoA transferase
MLLTGDDDLLSRLGALDRVGTRLDDALTTARTDANEASALAAQAQVAKAERERLSTSARVAAETADAAEAAADAAVAAQEGRLTELYAQLATLRNTTAQLEEQYRIGQQASNDAGSGGSSGGGLTVPGGEVNDVARFSAHPQLRRTEVATPAGPVAIPAPPPIVDGVRDRPLRAVPALGQHNAALRAEFA